MVGYESLSWDDLGRDIMEFDPELIKGSMMSEELVQEDEEVVSLVEQMRAAEMALGDLVRATDCARIERVQVGWKLVNRLIALANERPGTRWRVGAAIYWLEGTTIRSAPGESLLDWEIQRSGSAE